MNRDRSIFCERCTHKWIIPIWSIRSLSLFQYTVQSFMYFKIDSYPNITNISPSVNYIYYMISTKYVTCHCFERSSYHGVNISYNQTRICKLLEANHYPTFMLRDPYLRWNPWTENYIMFFSVFI